MFDSVLSSVYSAGRRTQRIITIAVALAFVLFLLLTLQAVLSWTHSSYLELQQQRHLAGRLTELAVATQFGPQRATPDPLANWGRAGTSMQVIAAELQNWVGDVALDTGAEVQSIEANTKDGQSPSVEIGAHIVGTWAAIQATIFRIESVEPPLFITNLKLDGSNDNEQSPQQIVNMEVQFKSVALVRKEKGP